jgi:hypothetical protein
MYSNITDQGVLLLFYMHSKISFHTSLGYRSSFPYYYLLGYAPPRLALREERPWMLFHSRLMPTTLYTCNDPSHCTPVKLSPTWSCVKIGYECNDPHGLMPPKLYGLQWFTEVLLGESLPIRPSETLCALL